MIVMPALAEVWNREPKAVPAVIVCTVGVGAERVSKRANAPESMMDHEESNHAAPEKPFDSTHPSPDQQRAGDRGQHKPQDGQDGIGVVYPDYGFIVAQVIGEAHRIGDFPGIQPAYVRIPEPPEPRLPSLPVQVGGMRITVTIAELVMPSVRGHPEDERPLDGHRSEDRQRDAHTLPCLVRAVGELAMKAYRNTDCRQRVHDQEDHDFNDRDPRGDDHGNGSHDANRGHQNHGYRQASLGAL